ncbi:1, 4-dihydroxy-2-naphthoateoctaprenyltransferase [Methanoculleus chikugoensis]|jgi:1,4-dihydroxy-2-naphthoate octaprenyltransferase|uniref:1, 4-dihydroxy-2-naphthoateoctaprenyltransferase n=1 Tax=Methanoculleus chikugoensis TaxID=118126 RepID=A0A1M4MJC7_9EURY|nr:prenyltransferase [Methanoculleus chikugoensis]MDD4566802.1 prenyltransferase [Methanoculleus chikugoensis]NMA11374.1 prenyltransferase [Methanomicrobiales archaeon]SCL74918.1 1, 4-dihydroxy-2-naphthoateoctaprenyltransferase [Methanoculleus chikugoensis]
MDTRALRDFIRLGRFPFLLSGFIPFTAGALLASLLGARFTPAQFLVGYAAMAAAHLSVHYSNDYFDTDADRFVETTPISGGSGVLAVNPGLKPAAFRAAVVLMAVSILIGYLFVTVYDYPFVFLVFGVAGNLLGWFYTAPPIALAYRNLGEVTNMITFGLLMPGAGYFVAMGTLDAAFFAFAVPLSLYGLVFITSVEIPDREGDIAGEKRTLIVRRGRIFGFSLIALAASLATAALAVFALTGFFAPVDFRPVALFSLIPLGIALWGFSNRCTERAPALRYATANIVGYFLFQGLVVLYFILAASRA